ncbi:tRNA (cytidine(34)-2'-O)-methyltransferase [bacterium]|nr:tRNA (cytidine(34)-2'-O)-methyltransferase [bacterium]
MFQIVLVEPQIPQNTGSIARMTAATGCILHLIEPTKFQITDKNVKRAGLDYWPEVKLKIHKDWQAFLVAESPQVDQLWFFTTKGQAPYYKANFKAGDFLVFGSETQGLSPWFHQNYTDRRLVIPMDNPNIRSLNLATSAGIVLYEARRQVAMR